MHSYNYTQGRTSKADTSPKFVEDLDPALRMVNKFIYTIISAQTTDMVPIRRCKISQMDGICAEICNQFNGRVEQFRLSLSQKFSKIISFCGKLSFSERV